MKAFRQGDVSILAVKDVPKQARRVKGELVLARGELSGHSHRIVDGKASLHRALPDRLFLRVESRSARLFHEEHEDVRLPRGNYEIRRQREFDPFGGRRGRGEVRYGMD
jgi:hypothetical protein